MNTVLVQVGGNTMLIYCCKAFDPQARIFISTILAQMKIRAYASKALQLFEDPPSFEEECRPQKIALRSHSIDTSFKRHQQRYQANLHGSLKIRF